MTTVEGFDNLNGTTVGLFFMIGDASGNMQFESGNVQFDLMKGYVLPEPPPEPEPSFEPFVVEILWTNLGDLPSNVQ